MSNIALKKSSMLEYFIYLDTKVANLLNIDTTGSEINYFL